jgi:hypothetical protein
MVITRGNISTGSGSGGSMNFAHTRSGGSFYGIMVLGISHISGTSVVGSVYWHQPGGFPGGQAFTKKTTVLQGDTNLDIWVLTQPSAVNSEITITMSSSASTIMGMVVDYTNVDNPNQIDVTVVTDSQSGGTTISNDITPVTDGAVILDFINNRDGAAGNPSPGGQQEPLSRITSGTSVLESSQKLVKNASTTSFSWSGLDDVATVQEIIALRPYPVPSFRRRGTYAT